MGFTNKTWTDPIALDASNINRIEQGIKNSHDNLEILNEEVSNLQAKRISIEAEISKLTNKDTEISNTLSNLSSLLQGTNNSVPLDNYLLKTSQTFTQEELNQVYSNLKLNNFLRLTDIRVNGTSIVKDSILNISVPTIDQKFNANSTNAISNKAVAEILANFNPDMKVPTKLSDLLQDKDHMTVTAAEKAKWNAGGSEGISSETDPTVPDWAKEPIKPFYSYSEIIGTPNNLSDFNNDLEFTTTTYVDSEINKLHNILLGPDGDAALDTINELASAIADNSDIIETLNQAITNKAAKDHTHTKSEITDIEPTIQFAESERQKSKNLYNAEAVPITNSYVTYDKDTNTFTYTVNNTIESASTSFAILKYGKLKPGTYTMSFNTTSTIGNTAPVIVAKLDEYDNFNSTITSKDIIDGYVYLTFTLNEETNIGLAWYYKAGWIAGDASPGVKTLTNLQLEEGSVATDYQPYNGAIVHEKQLTEQLSNYLPLAGGKMTGRISFADGNVALPETDNLQFITGIESYAAGGGMVYTNRDNFKQKLLQTNGAIIKGRVYGSGDDEGLIIEKADNGYAGLCLGSATGTRSVFYLNYDNSATWRWSNGSSNYDISHPQKAGTIALMEDCLPKDGGTLNGALLFPANATYSTTSQPTALSYGRLQAYGTLNINGNTDNSGTEYVNITAGHGCSSSTADGLSIGTDTLTWKNQDVIHEGNINSYVLPIYNQNNMSNKCLRLCQLTSSVSSGFAYAVFLVSGIGDYGGKFAGSYLVTMGTRGGASGSMKITALQTGSNTTDTKFGYATDPDNSSLTSYYWIGDDYNFWPSRVICLAAGGSTPYNATPAIVTKPSSYTAVSLNGDMECSNLKINGTLTISGSIVV